MPVTALAGGVGAGKFLRGVARVIDPADLTVVVNTGDDMVLHGLHLSPDLDSVTYWLADVADRERGWGRRGETFRAMDELRRIGGQSWFALGDTDLATHLARTELLWQGIPLSAVTEQITRALQVSCRVIPMTDDRVETRIDAVDEAGGPLDLHFQEYWVARGARDEVKGVRYEGADRAVPAPGVIEAVTQADAVLICPSNPVASIAPILAVPAIADALRERDGGVSGVSPIVGGAPLGGMADRLMPSAGLEVTALGAASAYRGLCSGFVIDERDAALSSRIESDLRMRVAVTDTVMTDDAAAERVARTALELAAG
ncbi:MAG TPA: 2-phospho-L-lactate transferase [Actinomycetota bacterium]|nr:2-phospho-L-lactate transferase [Actinomycetota bacterium]